MKTSPVNGVLKELLTPLLKPNNISEPSKFHGGGVVREAGDVIYIAALEGVIALP